MKARLVASALVLAFAALAVTSSASAHSMTEPTARKYAKYFADNLVDHSDGEYTKATVIGKCKKLFPHRVECRVGFDDESTEKSDRYACTERFMMVYDAHDRDERGSKQMSYSRISKHHCI